MHETHRRALQTSMDGLRTKSNVKRCLLSALRNAARESLNEEGRLFQTSGLRKHVCRTGFLFDRQRTSDLIVDGRIF